MAYCTLAEVKADIDLEDASASATATIGRLIIAAERNINRFCNRPDGFEADAVASARYFPGSGLSYQLIDETVDITTVAVKDSSTDSTYVDWTTPTAMMAGDGDWIPFSGGPAYPRFDDLPYTGLLIDINGEYSSFTSSITTGLRGFRTLPGVRYTGIPTVKVTAKWGFSVAVPGDITSACIMQVVRWYKRLQSAMADAVGNMEFGELRYTSRIDSAVAHILEDGGYVKPRTGIR